MSRSTGRWRWLPRLLWVALGAAAAGALFHLAIMPLFVRFDQETQVPRVLGLTVEEAGRLLTGADLSTGSVIETIADQVEAGQILRQTPQAGARVKRGRQVGLVVSMGPATQRVPDLAGESLVHARFLLSGQGATVGRVRAISHWSLPADQVVASSPRPGAPLGRRATVDLLISSGAPPRRFVMPDLRGRDVQPVRRALEAQGLRVRVRTNHGEGGWREEVVEQTPPPGYPIEAGGTVEILTGGG